MSPYNLKPLLRIGVLPAALLCPLVCHAEDLGSLLSFEAPQGQIERHWSSDPPAQQVVDGQRPHSGQWSGRIVGDPAARSVTKSSTLTLKIPIEFAGKAVELTGYLRTEGVTGFAGLWLRQEAYGGVVAFDNMMSRPVKGTTDWMQYKISLPIHRAARNLIVGAHISGAGRVWVDDLELFVDGEPLKNVARKELLHTVLDTDHEFDRGSRIAPGPLKNEQIRNLAMLGKVWGFLKYYHPAVTAGKYQWDYELLRVMPRVLAAKTSNDAQAVLVAWVDSLGSVPQCPACARPSDGEVHIAARLDWLETPRLLGKELGNRLQQIARNRQPEAGQFYASSVEQIGRAEFLNELDYPKIHFPDPGFQLIALFRYWNIIEYWYPYRDLIGRSWDAVLTEFVPRVFAAGSSQDYQLELIALMSRVQDSHANLWSGGDIRPPRGDCQLPVVIRFVAGEPAVAALKDSQQQSASALQRGDVLTQIDGIPTADLIKRWTPYYPASNQPTRLREMSRFFTRGKCGATRLVVRRLGVTRSLSVERMPLESSGLGEAITHDRPGETFQLLSKDIAYLKLSSVELDHARDYVAAAQGTKGWIIDIRNYPSAFIVFELGQHFVAKETPFARFVVTDGKTPGLFTWTPPVSLVPAAPHYQGKIVVLVDETSQSQSEYTAMAFRAAPGAVVVGSTTAGADGEVAKVPLPGGLSPIITGNGVFYFDKRLTQRIGIIPDIVRVPSLEGIRKGRDEVLEEAVRQIGGAEISPQEINAMLYRNSRLE